MEQLDEIFCTFAHTKHSRVKCTQSWTVNPQHWFSTVGNAFPVSLYMCASDCVCACFSSRSTLVIISYAWRPNPRWHLEWRAKGLSVQFPVSTVDGKGSTEERGESILYIFSAIEQSPRSADRQTPQRGWERQRWRERQEERESLSVRLQGGACCAWWYCGTFRVYVCVCVGSVVSSLGPGQGPPLSKVFVVELTRRGSFLVGTRLPVSAQTVPAWTPKNERGEKTGQIVTTAESVLNARWKPCCVLVANTPALEWSARCVCVYKIYSACVCVCACVSRFPLSAC